MRLVAFWRLRVSRFLRSVQCRHDGAPPMCLWCGTAALDPLLLVAQPRV